MLGISQTDVCDQINISVTGIAGDPYYFTVGSNVDTLIWAGTFPTNTKHRWRAYSYSNLQDCFDNSFDTSSACVNCLWGSITSEVAYTANFMDTLTVMLKMTIIDNIICTTIFGVAFDPSANNDPNGGFTYTQLNQPTSIEEVAKTNKKVVGVYNMLGQPVSNSSIKNEILIIAYSDGSTSKIFNK